MKNFGIGLALGLIGMMIWYVGVSLVACEPTEQDILRRGEWGGRLSPELPAEALEEGRIWQSRPLKYGGFGLMVAGPVVYWIILPVIEFIRKRE